MPEKRVRQRARRQLRRGKKATTAAGEYVGEEMRHAKSGRHKVKNRKQAIAIGLSKARRAGIKVPRTGRRTASRSSQAARTARSKSSRKGRKSTKRGRSRSKKR